MSSTRYPCQILIKLDIARYTVFSKNIQISNFMMVSPVEAEMFHAGGRVDGQTDMTKLIVAIRNFANTSKNIRYYDEDNFTPDKAD